MNPDLWMSEAQRLRERGRVVDVRIYTREQGDELPPGANMVVLGESGAICDYIDRKYGGCRLSPGVDDPDFADHLFWFHFSNATFMTNGMMGLVAQSLGAAEAPAFVADRVAKAWTLTEARLGAAEFFGGRNLTTADIMMGFNLTTSRAFGGMSLDAFPNIAAYLQRIGQRPAYQRAMAKAEPGMPPMLS